MSVRIVAKLSAVAAWAMEAAASLWPWLCCARRLQAAAEPPKPHGGRCEPVAMAVLVCCMLNLAPPAMIPPAAAA